MIGVLEPWEDTVEPARRCKPYCRSSLWIGGRSDWKRWFDSTRGNRVVQPLAVTPAVNGRSGANAVGAQTGHGAMTVQIRLAPRSARGSGREGIQNAGMVPVVEKLENVFVAYLYISRPEPFALSGLEGIGVDRSGLEGNGREWTGGDRNGKGRNAAKKERK